MASIIAFDGDQKEEKSIRMIAKMDMNENYCCIHE